MQREQMALKYLKNRISLSKSKTLVNKIILSILSLFFSKKAKSKDFEDMQKLLKENARYMHFR